MKIIKSNNAVDASRVRVSSGAASKQLVGPPATAIQQNDAGHSVKVNRANGEVDSIEVTCACGCQIMVRCEYE